MNRQRAKFGTTKRKRLALHIPEPVYEALPYVYACLGVGLLYLLDSGVMAVMGFVLLVSAGLIVYMRNSARKRAYQARLRKKQRDWMDS